MIRVDVKGLLLRFIKEKRESYVEPSRKGTPRGEIIGLSLEKYMASLFMLTSMNLKRTSERSKVSYGLIRKWRTETPFKGQIEKHIMEFAPLFIGYQFKRWAEKDEVFGEYYGSTDFPPEYDLKDYEPNLFMDDEIKFYGSSLKRELLEKSLMLGGEIPFLLVYPPFINICGLLADEKGSRERLLLKALDGQQWGVGNILDLIEMAVPFLRSPKSSESERKQATDWLDGAREAATMQDRAIGEVKKILKKSQ
jgi:hypothetical protein